MLMSSNKHKKKTALPALRFPEFQNKCSWYVPTLKEISERIVKKVGNLTLETVSITAGKGFVTQAEKFSRDISGQQYKNYIVLQEGEFSYNKGNSKKFPQGCIYKLKEFKKVAAPNAFISFKLNKGHIADFYQGYFDNNFHGKQLAKFITSGARSDGLLNISPSDFFSIQLPTPKDIQEQQKIADCLSSIDELIVLEAQKLDALKEHKTGLMQLLFPAEGEMLPQYRFAEFKNAPAWEEKPLGRVFTRIKTKNAENNLNCLTISAQDGLVSQLDYFNKKISAKDLTGYYLLRKGDFAYNKSYSQGYPMGAIKCLKFYDKGVVSTLYICFRINKGYSEDFFEYFFDHGMINPEIAKVAQEGARNHGLLNIGVNDFFERVNVKFPKLKEQQKIADCLSAVDGLITAQFAKVEALKTHKKGLMQQLFPAADEVTG